MIYIMKYLILTIILLIKIIGVQSSSLINIIKNNFKYECEIIDRKIESKSNKNLEYLLLEKNKYSKWILSNNNFNYNESYNLFSYPYKIGRKVYCKYDNDSLEMMHYRFCNHKINHKNILFIFVSNLDDNCDYYEINIDYRKEFNFYSMFMDISLLFILVLSSVIINMIINKI